MLFYWLVSFLKKIMWLFRLPPIEQFAHRNINQQCPVCGARQGSLRCVLMAKPGQGPVRIGEIPSGDIMCQHRCGQCGARWHEKPLAKEASPSTILPAVARDDIERAEDRMARLQEELAKPEVVI